MNIPQKNQQRHALPATATKTVVNGTHQQGLNSILNEGNRATVAPHVVAAVSLEETTWQCRHDSFDGKFGTKWVTAAEVWADIIKKVSEIPASLNNGANDLAECCHEATRVRIGTSSAPAQH